ncbi:MAG: hypothetical protein ACRC6E_03735 [Fusobacteriaceae bacterium]
MFKLIVCLAIIAMNIAVTLNCMKLLKETNLNFYTALIFMAVIVTIGTLMFFCIEFIKLIKE